MGRSVRSRALACICGGFAIPVALLSCTGAGKSTRVTTAEEAVLPVMNLPWPRQLDRSRFEHLVLGSRKAAFACARRLEDLTEENSSSSKTSRGFVLSAAVVGASTAAGTGAMQFINEEETRSDATAAIAIGGTLAATILASIAAYTQAESKTTATGKRIGEIQTAVRTFTTNWTDIVTAPVDSSPDTGGEAKGQNPDPVVAPPGTTDATAEGLPAGSGGTSGDPPVECGRPGQIDECVIVAQPRMDAGMYFEWGSVHRDKYFRGAIQTPSELTKPQQDALYGALVKELNRLHDACLSRTEVAGSGK